MADEQDQDAEVVEDELLYDNDGFEGYVEDTVDPGPWLLVGTSIFCLGIMLIVVPLIVALRLRQRQQEQKPDFEELLVSDDNGPANASWFSICSWSTETQKILKLAVPYTISSLASSIFTNVGLVLVSKNIGTKAVAAYALVQILVGLTDGVLYGPIYATTTLCAHAVGAGNTFLAGQYIQLAYLFYLFFSIPFVWFWWCYIYEVILLLEWGDEATALLAQDFTRVYIWSCVLSAISSVLWQLLEITDHAVEGTLVSIAWGFVNVVVIGSLVKTKETTTLRDVAWVYVGTDIVFIGLTFALATCRGWLKPFTGGLFRSFSLLNVGAIGRLMKQAIPLSFGSLLSNAEWAVLTFFAAHLGPAEVAAWAILGSIWDVFYRVTAGIGDAAEVRVAYHLGDNCPSMAKVSAYKALIMGMVVASVVSIVYFTLQHDIPRWFTSDTTLQAMLSELVPFVGVGNLTMTFGMLCWSLIGAQGEYKLATWISFVSSWGVVMPLSALYVFVFRLDLQGLTSAVVIGNVSTGACLSYVLLSTDWDKVAQKIEDQNAAEVPGMERHDDAEKRLYASLRYDSYAAKARARNYVRLVTLLPGQRSGVLLGNICTRPGTYVLMVRNWSPLKGHVRPGDSILAIDGIDVRNESANEISDRLQTSRWFDRHMAVSAPLVNNEEDDDEEDEQDFVDILELAEDETSVAPPTME